VRPYNQNESEVVRVRHWLMVLLGGLLLLGLASVPVLAGGGCDPNTMASEGTGSAVAIRDCGFNPVVLFVKPGTTVTWTNGDGHPPHNVVGVGWGKHEPFAQGGTAEHTFSSSGIYPYHCSLHPGMAGAIVVGDAADVAKDAAARVAGVSTTEQPGTAAGPNIGLWAAALVAAVAGGALIGRRLAR
jgi:plastocyanin